MEAVADDCDDEIVTSQAYKNIPGVLRLEVSKLVLVVLLRLRSVIVVSESAVKFVPAVRH